MAGKYIGVCLVFIFFIMSACGDSVQSMDLKNPDENLPVNNRNTTGQSFTITNEFQDHRGLGPLYLLLESTKTGESYIIPPTQYGEVELQFVVMDIKVEGECVSIPAEAFPVVVSVCESPKCAKVRPLDVTITNPAHYNLHGVGGLLAPQINPVSPCSPEFIQLIEGVGEEYLEL